METILIKIILSSLLLIGFYYLFLEKERIFKFNRIYLLSALVFAYIIPFISIKNPWPSTPKSNLIIGEVVQDLQTITVSKTESIDWMSVLFVGYILVSSLFLLKFIYSVFRIQFLKGKKIIYKNQNILIIDTHFAPFSFLNTIYLNQKHFNNNEIDERIFLHEKCHTDEKHSLDILFIEFLRIFSWFNPALYFYKKAMINNHEFLADEYVLQHNEDLESYQHLILNQIKVAQSFNLTHQFDFNNTKKRFIMMTSKTSRFTWLKKFTLLPVLAILFVLFTKKANAQNESKPVVEPTPVNTEKQDVAILINEKNATAEQKEFIQASKKLFEEYKSTKDTIKEKYAQDVAIPIPPPPPPPPHEFKGILPQFPDGINAFRTLVANNFNTSVFKGNEGVVKTVIYTNIGEDGRMTDVFAEGPNEIFNKEAERVIKLISADHVWKPATEDGQAVNYMFKLPLTMKFEEPVIKK